MRRSTCLGVAWMCMSSLVTAPAARAADVVTYDVASTVISAVNIEYRGPSGRVALHDVPIPWRFDVSLSNPDAPPPDGAELRVDWRPVAGASKWLTITISRNGKLLCQSILDIGDATCYGVTPHRAP